MKKTLVILMTLASTFLITTPALSYFCGEVRSMHTVNESSSNKDIAFIILLERNLVESIFSGTVRSYISITQSFIDADKIRADLIYKSVGRDICVKTEEDGELEILSEISFQE